MSGEHERLQRSWIANADAWCTAVRTQQIESRRLVTDAAIVETVLEERPHRVLDLGCGEGWLARALDAHGIAVTGVDASQPLIDAARVLGGGVFLTLSYEDLIANPSLAGASFDAVVANFALLDDRLDAILPALRALLAPHGRVIVQTVHPLTAGPPYTDGWRTETFDAFPGTWPEEMPWYFRTIGSWSRAFDAAGFGRVVVREPMHPRKALPASLVWVGWEK